METPIVGYKKNRYLNKDMYDVYILGKAPFADSMFVLGGSCAIAAPSARF